MSPFSNTSTSDRRYRAPAKDGEILCVPDFSQAISDAQSNAFELQSSQIEIAGLSLGEFRRQARHEIVSLAIDWTNQFTGGSAVCAECAHEATALYVTGHQPQLAHPGVWAKNFAVSAMAERSQSLGLNIIVDNDTVGTQSIRVPAGNREHPRFLTIAFDAPQPQQPWEELSIVDREMFNSFGERVCRALESWHIRPLIGEMWNVAVNQAEKTPSTCLALTACRVAQERRWGLQNLELPLSVICQSQSFRMFAAHLIRNAAEFHNCYNRSVEDYRNLHRIRNHRHPVPNLTRSSDALELPLWYWESGDATRGQLFVRQTGHDIDLLCGGRVILSTDDTALLQDLRVLQSNGKLRTRALTTTLFSRLCFADLFVHGIGGAKYDELTNQLIEEFFGQSPPAFLVLSATCHLPIDPFKVTEADARDLAARLRELKYNADRYLSLPASNSLLAEKRELISEQNSENNQHLPPDHHRERMQGNRHRHASFQRVNRKLSKLAANKISVTEQKLSAVKSQLHANAILQSREFSAVVFPAEQIHLLSNDLQVMAKSAAAKS